MTFFFDEIMINQQLTKEYNANLVITIGGRWQLIKALLIKNYISLR